MHTWPIVVCRSASSAAELEQFSIRRFFERLATTRRAKTHVVFDEAIYFLKPWRMDTLDTVSLSMKDGANELNLSADDYCRDWIGG